LSTLDGKHGERLRSGVAHLYHAAMSGNRSRRIAQSLQNAANDPNAKVARGMAWKPIIVVYLVLAVAITILSLFAGQSFGISVSTGFAGGICLMIFIAPIMGMFFADKARSGGGKSFRNKGRW
jgi:hypothetical protein